MESRNGYNLGHFSKSFCCSRLSWSRRPSTDERIKTLWYMYSGILLSHKKEWIWTKAESMPDLFGIHNPWILLQNAKCWILVELTRNVISVLSCISSWPPVCKETFVAYSSCCRYHLFLFIIYGIREVLFCILYFKISQVTFPRHITSKCQN